MQNSFGDSCTTSISSMDTIPLQVRNSCIADLKPVILAVLIILAPLCRQNAFLHRVTNIVQFAQAQLVATQNALHVNPLIGLRNFVQIEHTAQIIALLDLKHLPANRLVQHQQIHV
jgi:hypothetical protein